MKRMLARLVCVALVAGSAIVAIPRSSDAAPATQLRRYPYLTNLVGQSVTVNWATQRAATIGSVRWGKNGFGGCNPTNSVAATRTALTVNAIPVYQWAATITLPAGGSYCYRVYLADTDLLGTDPSPRFGTQIPAGSTMPFSFAVFGDWGQADASGNPEQANLMARIASSGVRFAVTTGDNGYPSGSQDNYGDLQTVGLNKSGVFGPSFWAVPGRSIPLFPAIGNHGLVRNDANHPHLVNWPQPTAVATSAGRYQKDTYCCPSGSTSTTMPSAWYAFDAGNARFYVLDATWDDANNGTGDPYLNDFLAHWEPGDPEYEWLKADLESHPTALKFAFLHSPLYSDQREAPSNPYLQYILEGLLKRNGVDIAFSGHAHVYQRNTPNGANGLVNYVTAGGGASLQSIGATGCSPNDAYGLGWSETNNVGNKCGSAPVPDSTSRVYHFLKVSVNGTQVTVTPTDSLGRTFDVQTYNFGSGPPETALDSAPGPGATKSTSATFTFHSVGPSTSFQCKLDTGAFAACTSPKTYSGLAAGNHTFAVRAVGPGGTDASPATATWTVDLTPPAAPTGLTATAVSGQRVDLSWAAATDANGIASYRVLRNGAQIAANVTGTTYVDASTVPGATYTYVVRAVDTAGNVSANSAPKAVTTPSGTPLVFSDGFESGNLAAWTSSSGLVAQNALSHGGAFAARGTTTNGGTYAKKTLPATYPDAYARVWFNVQSASSQVNLLRMRTATEASIAYLYVTPTGQLRLRNDVGATTTLSATTVPAGWHSLELHTVVNGASSTIEVWLDGTKVTDLSSASVNLGTTPVGRLQIGEVQAGRTYDVLFDDVAFGTVRIG